MENVEKLYPKSERKAVEDFNIIIQEGEFIVFVGPSGCGKTTTLRMIAGLEEITSGTLTINGKKVNDKDPIDRDISMVFQSYGLFPHMTVYDNIGFGLKIRKIDKKIRKERIQRAAKLLGLTEFLSKRPGELSGGQRQRVALGRAIVKEESDIFLMDEPLSNLDAKLRVTMREEIMDLHKKLNSTTIYVTHDQVEAMTMANRIVVMNKGIVQQIGTPWEVYKKPSNLFVATFIGSPPMNIIRGKISGDSLYSSDKQKILSDNLLNKFQDQDLYLGFRPEHARAGFGDLEVSVESVELLGSKYNIHGYFGDSRVVLEKASNAQFEVSEKISIDLRLKDIYFFSVDSEERIEVPWQKL